MNTVFIGGSRHVSRLPAQVWDRIGNIIENGHRVVVGDANGADKAVQKVLFDVAYKPVTVYCSGAAPRNNLGDWPVHNVTPPKGVKGFQFYAAKDREMAKAADFGLMVWDGKSPGTILNVLRLVRTGKIAVLINVPEKATLNIKSATQWDTFLETCSPELRADLRERATDSEWQTEAHAAQPSLLEPLASQADDQLGQLTDEELAVAINAALASGDSSSVVDALGSIARAEGMTQVAKEAGLARESLYRSLGSGGNPEFATVLKVMGALGFSLKASRARLRPKLIPTH